MDNGGQYATCLTCGMCHTMDRLRRMLTESQHLPIQVQPVTPTPVVQSPQSFVRQQNPNAAPQFVMQVNSAQGD